MKKIIPETDKERGILQVTIADERWYVKQVTDPATKLPALKYVPSVTWIAGHYPKGIGFYKWLADKGWDESQAIKSAAGDKGSKVHEAISAILRGEEVRIDSKFINPSTEQLEELTLEECDAIKSFVDWKNENKPESIAWDVTVFSEKYGYGGTIDYICKIDRQVYIIDFKTSAEVWSEYELQVSAYKHPIESGEFNVEGFTEVSDIKLAILQIGYRRNKAGYKWNEIEDKFPLFLAARQIWANECGGQAPKMREYPIVLSPAVTVEQAMAGKPEVSTPRRKASVSAK
ncbi:hypothetical protein UNPF46_08505 [Bradyrhizobium sp. UNPF46]|uniref:PD-(D/E)XK nuclease family protein n=1 Tax=Bradyrhizobium sp. UNPF46 TaxID=1141168 RepID=UPI00115352D7|nr:PD-(D/E)XK nuclease family protein [Bradyrhizobium sp. UNPF46]TQF41152.1 hypothetical protein UNPF46_08505 [Bradyrhizobium sp. UNPF46]